MQNSEDMHSKVMIKANRELFYYAPGVIDVTLKGLSQRTQKDKVILACLAYLNVDVII